MIVVLGLSHRTAPIAIREMLVLDRSAMSGLLRRIVTLPGVGEAMLVSTCNRVEIVAASSDGPLGALEPVESAARSVLLSVAPACGPYLRSWRAAQAVRHLFRVASSLDSLVVGEPQILGQVKDAFELARSTGTVGPTLHRVVTRALKAAKRVRSETEIGSGQVSVPSVALELAQQIFGELGGHPVALLGSGEMAESIARLLRQAGATLMVVGRNPARIDELAGRFQGEALVWDRLQEALVRADVIVTSTSAPGYVVTYGMAARAHRSRRGRSLFVIDVAVPRDVDPSVDGLDGAFLYNIDDLSNVVAQTLSSRQDEAEQAERIVACETEGYERWVECTQVTPTIVSMRQRLGSALDSELERSLKGPLKHLGDRDREALRVMLGAALNKMLHAPSVRLKQATQGHGEEAEQLASALHDLFLLDEPPDSSSSSYPPPSSLIEGPGSDGQEAEAPTGPSSSREDVRARGRAIGRAG